MSGRLGCPAACLFLRARGLCWWFAWFYAPFYAWPSKEESSSDPFYAPQWGPRETTRNHRFGALVLCRLNLQRRSGWVLYR